LLAPHHRAVAAASELRTIRVLRTALADGGILTPQVVSFPDLCSAQPDVSYLRHFAGRGIIAPPDSGSIFVVIGLPDLDLRTLAVCLERRYGDTALGETIRNQGSTSVRLRIAQRVSRLEPDEFLERLAQGWRRFGFGTTSPPRH
jgi:hypothetical protein